MSSPHAPVLELKQLGHHHGAHATFSALNLSVASGTVCCLLGPSGCGKTTVLRCIGGFDRVSEGEVRIDGQVVGSTSVHVAPEQRRIGMVFQDYALFPHLTVLRNVGFGVHDRRLAHERAMQLLDTVGLASAAGRYPHELSGGQQQRVALGGARARRPRLLLVGEPLSSLEVEVRGQLAAEVRTILKASGTTAVFVTHDQNEAFAMADEIAVMNEGRIQQVAGAYELYHRPNSRFVADFIGQGVFVEGTVIGPQRLRLEIGEVATTEPIRFANTGLECVVGERVDVLMRPDDVLHDDGSTVRATVQHKAFRGAEILYTLQLASGARVLALVPSHHNHALQEDIGVRLDMDHVIAFARAA